MKNHLIISLCCLWLTTASANQPFQVSPELIQQMFDMKHSNQHVPKRPFNLPELSQLLTVPQLSHQDAVELTRRYLSISYPAGTVNLNKLLKANLPTPVKKILLSAPSSQVLLKGEINPLTLLDTSADILSNLSAVQFSKPLSINEMLSLNNKKYTANIYYGSYISMKDINLQEYMFSTPRNTKHHLAAFLEQNATTLSYYFTTTGCQQSICRSRQQGSSYASFEMHNFSSYGVQANDQLEISCQYDGIYRRSYVDKTEMQFKFKQCALIKLNGKSPHSNLLLEDLKRVKP